MQPIYSDLPVGSLRFDPENPRFLGSVDPSRRESILSFMLRDAGLLDLMRSIAAQGFFPGEPLLVTGSDEQGYVVVEGNRRFAASLLLEEPELAPISKQAVTDIAGSKVFDDLNRLPCLIFGARGDILKHLGYRHVTGIKEWEPLAKARFLKSRFDSVTGNDSERLRTLARTIGSRSDYVGRLLTALIVYQRIESHHFFNIENLSDDTLNFSLISSMLAYTSVVEYVGLVKSTDLDAKGLDDSKLEFLTRFIFERKGGRTRLGESRNLGRLAEVLSIERSREALESGASLSRAAQLAGTGKDAFFAAIGTAVESIEEAESELEKGLTLDQVDLQAIDSVQDAVDSLRSTAGV